jgi:DNA-binding NarL/FixJ family response regulator
LRILLVDDHNLFRRGLRLMLADLAADLDISEAQSCDQALTLQGETFELVLLDINMPGRTGLECLQSIKQAFADAFVVILSGEEDAKTVRAAIDLGAAGFVPKTSSPEIMIRALQLVLGNGIYLPPQVLLTQVSVPDSPVHFVRPENAHPSALLKGMTQRQIVVLKLALKGAPNKVIARQLDISEGTVKSHLSTVFRLLDVRNRTEALYRVAQIGEPI